MNITVKKDARQVRAFTHKLADIANGACLYINDLVQAAVCEGAPVGKDSDGYYHICKTAILGANAANDATVYKVKKGHNFKVGDIIMAAKSAKAYAITTIATDSDDATLDDLTVGTTLGVALSAGAVLMQAASAGASGSDYKYAPVGLLGEGYDVKAGENLFVNIVTIGQIKEGCIGCGISSAIKADLKHIVFI